MRLLSKVGLGLSKCVHRTKSQTLVYALRHASSSPREQHIVRSLAPRVDIPDDLSLHHLLVARAETFTNRVAMIDAVTGEQHTYGAFLERVERVSSALTRRGLHKGDVVCVYAGNSTDFVYLLLGTIQAGGVVTTVNPAYTASELLYQLTDSQPKFLACSADISHVAAQACDQYGGITERFSFGAAAGFTSFSELLSEKASSGFRAATVDVKEDLAILPYSSGTTGRPKGVMLTHHNLVANLFQYNSPLTDMDRPGVQETYLCVLPMFHIYGLFVVLLYSLMKGNTMVVMPSFDRKLYLDSVAKYKVSLLHIVPPMALALTQYPGLASYDLSSVHTAMSAAAPMGRELQDHLMRALGIATVKQGYGLSETSPLVTASPQVEPPFGSIGVLLANTEALVVDKGSGQAVTAPGQAGELWVRGPQVMKGYLNRPEATAETIDSDGWFQTGDVVIFDEAHNFYIVDRVKELIKYKGFQVAPAELEALLISHPGVADAAVIGVPDQAAGELPRAYVVPKPDGKLTEEEIHQFVKEHLAFYKQLRGGVEFTDTIPKSSSGKILRRMLRDAHKPS